jgi:hypothetical protein
LFQHQCAIYESPPRAAGDERYILEMQEPGGDRRCNRCGGMNNKDKTSSAVARLTCKTESRRLSPGLWLRLWSSRGICRVATLAKLCRNVHQSRRLQDSFANAQPPQETPLHLVCISKTSRPWVIMKQAFCLRFHTEFPIRTGPTPTSALPGLKESVPQSGRLFHLIYRKSTE